MKQKIIRKFVNRNETVKGSPETFEISLLKPRGKVIQIQGD